MTRIRRTILELTRARAVSSQSLRYKAFKILFGKNYVRGEWIDIPNPFKELPNISSLGVKVREKDPLLLRHQVSKKIEPELVFSALSWRTKASNRYMKIFHWRLSKLLNQGDIVGYWLLCFQYMESSYVLRAVALRKWNLNWHKDLSFAKVKQLLGQLDHMLTELPTSLHIVRNYVEKTKADGTKTYRPIGNPGYAERMYFYIWQCFILMHTAGYISKHQHAYVPERGVVTALKELNDRLRERKFKDLWEFDLKGAFPSVNIARTFESLRAIGLPEVVSEILSEISFKTIERVDLSPQGKLLEEPKFERQAELAEKLQTKFVAQDDLWSFGNSVSELSQLPNKYVSRERIRMHAKYEIESTEIEELLLDDDWGFETAPRVPLPKASSPSKDSPAAHVGRNLLDKHASVVSSPFFREMPGPKPEVLGFPQGAGFSPVLFNFAFEEGVNRGHFASLGAELLSYADDFLSFFSRTVDSETIFRASKVMQEHGLEFNREKSAQLVRNGRWIVDKFKFLGVTLHVPKGQIVDYTKVIWEGTPKSGKHLIFDREGLILDYNKRQKTLQRIIDYFKLDLTPDGLLKWWSDGRLLTSLIPYEVFAGSLDLTESDLDRIKKVLGEAFVEIAKSAKEHAEKQGTPFLSKFNTEPEGFPSFLTGKKVSDVFDPNFLGSKAKGPSSSEGYELPIQETIPKKNWLEVPQLAGMITNRLHGGSWASNQSEASRSLAPKADRSWIELALKTVATRAFRDVPRAFRDWIVSQDVVIKAYNEFVATETSKPEPWKVTGDQWVTQFLKRLRVQENLDSIEDVASNLSIFNSTSYATLACLKFIKDPKTYKIKYKSRTLTRL